MNEKHKYKVVCKCGDEQINNDDVVPTKIVKATVSWCKKCCPGRTDRLYQNCYDEKGNRWGNYLDRMVIIESSEKILQKKMR